MEIKRKGLNCILTILILALGAASVFGQQLKPDEEDYILNDVKWGLTNKNKTDTCILLNGILQVLIPYETSGDALTDVTLLTIPRNASVYGICGDPIQNITLSWPSSQSDNGDDDVPKNPQHSITFTFVKKGEYVGEVNDTFSEPFYQLESVHGEFHAGEAEFPGYNREKTKFTFIATHLSMVSAPVGLSYFCQTTQVVDSDNHDATLMLSLLQAQAFHDGLSDTGHDGVDFGSRSYCPVDGYKMILSVVGFVMFLALIGITVFLIMNWIRPKRRAGYWDL